MSVWLFLRAYWKPLCILVLVIAGWLTLAHWGNSREKQGYARAQAEAKDELQKWREHEKEVDDEVQHEYWSQMDTLRAQADKLRAGRPIRCVLGDSNQVRDAKHPSGTPAGPTGESALLNAPDLRPRILQAGQQCEDLRQKLIAIKAWQEALQAQSSHLH